MQRRAELGTWGLVCWGLVRRALWKLDYSRDQPLWIFFLIDMIPTSRSYIPTWSKCPKCLRRFKA